MSAAAANGAASAPNGAQSAFNAKEVAAYLRQSWSTAVDESNRPGVPAADKPEMYKAPAIAGNGPAAAWGASASAWAPRPSAAARETQVADGQPFLIALAKAVEASKKGASASDSAAGAKK